MNEAIRTEIENGGWHLRKEVTLGTLIALMMMFGGMVLGYVDIKTDLNAFKDHMEKPAHEVAESRLDRLEQGQAAINASAVSIIDRLDEMIRRLERIEDRLNRDGGG